MNISKQVVDNLNLVIKIEVTKDDYARKVEDVLKNYTKTASIPGFRKGQVPLGMVRQKYGKNVKMKEINKLIQEALGNFLKEEKINYLGNPVPKNDDAVDLNQNDLIFNFELGLVPQFEVSLKTKDTITQYEIDIDEAFIKEELTKMQKHFGKISPKERILDVTDEITVDINYEELEKPKKATFELGYLVKKNQKSFEGKKSGDVIKLNADKLFDKKYSAESILELASDKLNVDIEFIIKEVNSRDLAELNQDLFDKIYGKDNVKSLDQVKEKIKKTYLKQFLGQTDQYLLNKITETLIKETKFELPEAFLKRWMQFSAEKSLTKEEADKQFNDSEKGLKYQLIESKIIEDNNIDLTMDDLKDYAKNYVQEQMLQFGRTDAKDSELNDVADRILANKEEANKLSSQLMSERLLKLYKKEANLKVKKVSFDKFIEEAYR